MRRLAMEGLAPSAESGSSWRSVEDHQPECRF
jgi:hypothetical protein